MDISHLDIVSFSVPYPPNYGGAIDVYYKIVALQQLGVRVHLHCFTYDDKQPSPEIERLCGRVTYYKRDKGINTLLTKLPYVVATRMPGSLLANLASGSGPILFEGLHTCGFVGRKELKHRQAIIRMHNIEWEYYMFLCQTSSSWWRKLHFKRESIKLRRFERKVVFAADGIFAISAGDSRYFSSRHKNVHILAPFHQYEEVMVLPGEGDYVLLHGDLSVEDNLAVVEALAAVCIKHDLRYKVAGRSPGEEGIARLQKLKNAELHLNVSSQKMQELMQQAQVQIVDSSITSGFKLKLLSALFTARHIVVRNVLVSNNLSEVVHTYTNRSEIASLLIPLLQQPVS
ncbi:MAG: hypothetical protein DRI69_04115, partial [Bacteroidetes bacterium]